MTKNQAQKAKFISQSEEPQVLLDLGRLNGNPKINKI